jgi:hypothetical protein
MNRSTLDFLDAHWVSLKLLTFRDELQRAAEDSESGLSPLGAIIQELMA